MQLTPQQQAQFVQLGLLALRLLPMAWLAPWFALRAGPRLLGLALVFALTLALAPLALSSLPVSAMFPFDATLLARAGAGALRGTLFGLAVALPLHAFTWAGELAEIVRSSSVVASEDSARPLADLQHFAALAIFFASGSHRLVLSAFASTLQAYPLGSLPAAAALAPALLATASFVTGAFTLAVTLVAPIFLCVLIAVLLLGLLQRAALFVGSAMHAGVWSLLALGAGCLVLAHSLPALPLSLRVFMQHAEQVLRMLG